MNAVNVTKLLGVVLVSFCAAACMPIPLLPVVAVTGEGSNHKYPKMAAWYQKKDRIGRTDYEQRKADMIACGMPPDRYSDNLSYVGPPGESNQEYLARKKKFLQCMKDKGYIWFTAHDCGYLEENRMICKLN
jgi:hypothetical protein